MTVIKPEKRFEFHELELADWQNYSILDHKEHKVVCNFFTPNGAKYCKEFGNKITDFLNSEEEKSKQT